MGNKMVVFDCETTGLDPINFDLIQLAAIVLRTDYTPDKDIPPFYLMIRPAKFQYGDKYLSDIEPAMKVNKLSLTKIMESGFEAGKAAALFEEWWQLSGGQPLDPLCQNYPFDSAFVRSWLGPVSYSHYFSRYYRDTYVASRFLTDMAEYAGCANPFPTGFSLSKLAKQLKIDVVRAHDAFNDCITTAEVYKRLCTHIPIPKEKITSNLPERQD